MAENNSENPGLREKLIAEFDKAKQTGDNSRLSDIQKQMRQMPGLKIPQEYLGNVSEDLNETAEEETAEFGQPSNISSNQNPKPNAAENYQRMVGEDQAAAPKPKENLTPAKEASLEPKAPNIFGRARNAIRIPGIGRQNSDGENSQAKNIAGKAEEKKDDIKSATNIAKHGAEVLSGNLVAAGQLIRDLWKNKKSRKLIYLLFAVPLLLIITETAVFASFMGLLSNKNINAMTGGTMTQAVDPIKDSDWIEKVLGLAGDTNIGSKMSATLLTGLASNVASFSKQNTDPNIATELTTISNDISAVQGSKNDADAKKLVGDLTTLIKATTNTMPKFSDATRAPLDNITDYNQDLFAGTPQNKDTSDKTIPETYTQTGQGTCDAVKLFAAGKPLVYPMFAGKIITVADDGAKAEEVIIQSSDGNYDVLYAHLSNVIQKAGDSITIDKSIGNINDAYIQLEAQYKGKCIVTDLADKIDMYNSSRQYPTDGQYLWQNIKTVFNLP